MHRPVYKPDLKFSYSRRHFSWLPQEVSKRIINFLSQKVSYDSMAVYPIINGFITKEVRIRLYFCDLSIITFGRKTLCLGSSGTSHVDSLDRFRGKVI